MERKDSSFADLAKQAVAPVFLLVTIATSLAAAWNLINRAGLVFMALALLILSIPWTWYTWSKFTTSSFDPKHRNYDYGRFIRYSAYAANAFCFLLVFVLVVLSFVPTQFDASVRFYRQSESRPEAITGTFMLTIDDYHREEELQKHATASFGDVPLRYGGKAVNISLTSDSHKLMEETIPNLKELQHVRVWRRSVKDEDVDEALAIITAHGGVVSSWRTHPHGKVVLQKRPGTLADFDSLVHALGVVKAVSLTFSLEPPRTTDSGTSTSLRQAHVSRIARLKGHLQVLDLTNNNKVTEVLPLCECAELDHLILSGTAVTEISPLVALDKLTTLELDDTGVTDVNALAELPNLATLRLNGAAVRDIGALTKAPALTELSVESAPYLEAARLLGPSSLMELNLSGSLATVVQLTDLENLGILFVNNCGTTELGLANLPWLLHLEIIGSDSLPSVVLSGLPELETVQLQENDELTSAELSELPSLRNLVIQNNPKLTTIRLWHIREPDEPGESDLDGNASLKTIWVSDLAILGTQAEELKKQGVEIRVGDD